jgi:two-component sensor histidine kinase
MSNPCSRNEGYCAASTARIMLAELNHRVGNELTAALTALRIMQLSREDTGEPAGILDMAVRRLEHFGELHDILDRNGSYGCLNDRLEALCRAISVAKAAPRRIHIELSADEMPLDDEIAWTVCAIVSELLTNVLKHAFDEDEGGLVVVELRDERGAIAITVADNGGRYDMTARSRRPACANMRMGWGIVTQLTERLGGTISRRSGSYGTTVTVEIPAGPADH